MLLEEYPYKNHTGKRIEDNLMCGYELYRVGVSGECLVPLCVGAYGFGNMVVAKEDAKKRFETTYYLQNGYTDIFSVYVKIYEMDKNRDVIQDSIVISPIFIGEVKASDECLRTGIIEQETGAQSPSSTK